MKLGARKLGYATCKLSQSSALPKHLMGTIVELTSLHVPAESRREGYATELLRTICDEADEAKKLLMVIVRPFSDGVMSQSQLTRMYERFGFVEIQAKPCIMARMVGATPRILNRSMEI